MALVMVKLSELDPQHLSVGSMKPPGRPPEKAGRGCSPLHPGPGWGHSGRGDHGGVGDHRSGHHARLPAQGRCRHWTARPEQQEASIDIGLSWDPDPASRSVPSGQISSWRSAGRLFRCHRYLKARCIRSLSSVSQSPLYSVALGLGSESARPGVHATVDLDRQLGALDDIVHIQRIDESSSPKLTLTERAGPQLRIIIVHPK
jgi:hypothetical protein